MFKKNYLAALTILLTLLLCAFNNANAGNLIVNFDFESGNPGWTTTSSASAAVIENITGAGGNGSNWYARLGKADNVTERLYQDIVIPANTAVATFRFKYKIDTLETTTSSVYDDLNIDLIDTATNQVLVNVASMSNLDKTNGWTSAAPVDISMLRGKTVRILVTVTTDSGLITNFYVDDVVVDASPVKIVQIDTGVCPAVNATVTFIDPGGSGGTGSLTVADFIVKEDGIEQTPITVNRADANSASGNAVTLVLDYSGSMGSLTGQTVIDMQNAATGFVNQLRSTDFAEVMKFSTSISLVSGFTNDKTSLVNAITSNWSGSGGGTKLYDALYQAVSNTSAAQGNKAIIVITDGFDEGSVDHTINDVIAYANTMGVPIYSIGLGTGVKPDILNAISGGTGGYYYYSANSSELASIYQSISSLISNQYIITYRSELIDRQLHTVTVESTHAGFVGNNSRTFLSCGSASQNSILLPSDNGSTDGFISNAGVPTYYKFTATVTGEYRIYTTGAVDTYGTLYDTTGILLDGDNDGGTYPNFLLKAALTAGQEYTIRVVGAGLGNYTLVVERPGAMSDIDGNVLFSPIYPAENVTSMVMQGGKAKRVYHLLNATTNGVIPYKFVHYQTCTQEATPVCSAKKDTASDVGGFVVIETDWITDAPGSIQTRTIKLVDNNGIPLGADPANLPVFSIQVFPRSLKQDVGLTAGRYLGAGFMGGASVGVVDAYLFKTGFKFGLGVGASLVFDSNDYAVSYDQKDSSFKYADRTVLGLNANIEPSYGVVLEGPELSFGATSMSFINGELKKSWRDERNDKFPEFFSTDPALQANSAIQSIGLSARLYQLSSLFLYGGQRDSVSSFLLNSLVSKLYSLSNMKDFRDEKGYRQQVDAKLGVGMKLQSVLTSKSGSTTMLPEFSLMGFDGGVQFAIGESMAVDGSSSKKNTSFTYNFSISSGVKFAIPLPVKSLKLNLGVNPSLSWGGTYDNEIIRDAGGRIKQIKLGMTTDSIAASSGTFFGGGLLEKKVNVITTDPRYAEVLYNNGIGVRALAGAGLLGGSLGLVEGDLHNDLFSILNYKHVTGLGLVNYSPLRYYVEQVETRNFQLDLPFDFGEGIYAEIGLQLGAIDSIAQITTVGVSLAQGNFETEEYQPNDSFVQSKVKGINDVTSVYGKHIKSAVDAVVVKASAMIDQGKVAVNNLVDGGVEIAQSVGSSFYNGANYLAHLASTIKMPVAQNIVTRRADTSATSVAAVTVGQMHFANLKDPAGVDLTDFPAPLTLSLGYSIADLTAAGLTVADASRLRIYRWDSKEGCWLYLGGTVNTTTQSVTIDITRKGGFVLAIDNAAPVINGFAALDNTTRPVIGATLIDGFSGIDTSTIAMDINGIRVVDSANWQNYFNPVTGAFEYRPSSPLSPGSYTAVLSIKDTSGNTASANTTFQVNANTVSISHTPPASITAGTTVPMQITVSGTTVKSAWLSYRLGMDGPFKVLIMNVSGSACSASIPAADTNGKMLTYYFEIAGDDGYITYAPLSAPTVPYVAPISEGSTRKLVVAITGPGAGSINATPALTCTSSGCSGTFAPGTVIALNANPDSLSVFGGWSGDCEGSDACVLTLNANANVTAAFHKPGQYRLTATISGTGSGAVNSTLQGFACSSQSCSGLFDPGANVTLTAEPGPSSVFSGWSGGGCSGICSCTVAMSSAKQVTANFTSSIATRNLLQNPGFESGGTAWTESPVGLITNTQLSGENSGSGGSAWYASLGGGNNLAQAITQDLT
ncbi:MAG: VWA domain-containing protein, partial [Deltaproteobacteria bacterium]|nr:VWA domain-containing protein [Deltaproteobacteria bacterium]